MKFKNIFLTFIILISLSGCDLVSVSGGIGVLSDLTKDKLTPEQIQSLQTRNYDANPDIVFSSVVSVLLDLGYTISNTDKSTGIIVAQSAAESSLGAKLLHGISDVTHTRANAFVEKIGNKTTLRLNFVEVNEESDMGHVSREDTQILNPEIYKNAFDKIDNAVFIRKSNS